MKFHKDFVNAFGELEKNGIGVNTDFTKIFGEHMLKYIHNKKIYQNYNFFTTTSRPSNSIHNLNFAALTPDMRKAFSPLNDVFVEFDFASYHPRLIAKLIDYDFGNSSVYGKLADDLNVTESEAKTITFQNLYGGVRKDIAKMRDIAREFPGSILVFATLNDDLTATEKKLIKPFVNTCNKYYERDRPKNPVMVLTSNELFSYIPPPYCWKDKGGKHKPFAENSHIHGLLDICQATQKIYLGIEPWSKNWEKEWKRRAAIRASKD